jgi:hypothetical protein
MIKFPWNCTSGIRGVVWTNFKNKVHNIPAAIYLYFKFHKKYCSTFCAIKRSNCLFVKLAIYSVYIATNVFIIGRKDENKHNLPSTNISSFIRILLLSRDLVCLGSVWAPCRRFLLLVRWTPPFLVDHVYHIFWTVWMTDVGWTGRGLTKWFKGIFVTSSL